MKKKLITAHAIIHLFTSHLIYALVVIVLVVSFAALLALTRLLNDMRANTNRPLSNQEVIYACEKLSATATNDKWSYAKCLQNMRKAGETNSKATLI